MSTGAKMPLAQAEAIANQWLSKLEPLCHRVAVAGSIRRRKDEVGDIEICAVPHPAGAFALQVLLNAPEPTALLGREGLEERKGVRRGDLPAWTKAKAMELAQQHRRPVRVKGGYPGKYVQLALPEGTCLDLFMPDAPAWGLVYTIRTGSAEFSAALASLSKRKGYIWHEGRVYRRGPGDKPEGQPFDLPEEQDVFRFFGVRWVEPEERVDGQALWGAARNR